MNNLRSCRSDLHINPECQVGKHTACHVDAWCAILAAPASCACECHG